MLSDLVVVFLILIFSHVSGLSARVIEFLNSNTSGIVWIIEINVYYGVSICWVQLAEYIYAIR